MLAQALQWAAANPLAVFAVVVAVALVLKDLSMRLPVAGSPGPKAVTVFPVMGSLPSQIGYVSQGRNRDYMTANCEANDWKTWAHWNPIVSEIVITSPESARHMFNTHFTHYELPELRREATMEVLGEGIFNSDGERWKDQRAWQSHLFSAKQLKQRMNQVFHLHAGRVREVLEGVKPGVPINIEPLMYSYTFDAIAEIAFGVSVNSLGGVAHDLEFQRAFDACQARISERFFDLFWRQAKFLNIGKEAQFKRDLKVVEDYIKKILSEREVAESLDDTSADLLSIFEVHCAEKGVKPSYQDYRDLIMSFFVAGRDTTASLLTWSWWELSKDSAARERVEGEVRGHSDVDSMQYMQAVLQETLRMHPSVHTDQKQCVRDDVLPDGTKVKKGCLVGFHPGAFCRNPNIYPKPFTFDPDRWMEEDGRCRKYDEYAYPVFNAGPRICLGRHMAMLEAKTLLSEVMSTVRVQVVSGFKPEVKHTIVLQTKDGMMVNVEKRAD
eukprot:Hpha_TRINITY_DN26201_c0_g1::TRINITY_DN26201_c0_g1_i1::g.184851::m.184851